jgi:hypothetical protein
LKIARGPLLRLAVKLAAILALTTLLGTATRLLLFAGQAPKPQSTAIPVRYTDVRKEAGISFVQDATQTEEKYYLETMGTGVAWLDYDQDGLMDLFFVQSAELFRRSPLNRNSLARFIILAFAWLLLRLPRRRGRLRLVLQDNQELADFAALLLDGDGFGFGGFPVELHLLL